jgi:hypothetical protein
MATKAPTKSKKLSFLRPNSKNLLKFWTRQDGISA